MQLHDEGNDLDLDVQHTGLEKDESSWPIGFSLRAEEKQTGRWTSLSWSIDHVALYKQAVAIDKPAAAMHSDASVRS